MEPENEKKNAHPALYSERTCTLNCWCMPWTIPTRKVVLLDIESWVGDLFHMVGSLRGYLGLFTSLSPRCSLAGPGEHLGERIAITGGESSEKCCQTWVKVCMAESTASIVIFPFYRYFVGLT